MRGKSRALGTWLFAVLIAGCGMDSADAPLGRAAQALESAPVCGTTGEGPSVTLTCPSGQLVSVVDFASYGTPGGSCGAFTLGACHASSSRTVVEGACLGKASCTVAATNATFGDPCPGTYKSLALQVRCASASAAPAAPGGLRVVSVGDGTVTLDWNDSTDLRAGDKYQIYADDPTLTGEDQWAGRESTTSEFTVTGLVNGRTYGFRVSAGQPGSYGPWSDPAVPGTPSGSSPTCTKYVALTGSDTNAGTLAAPFRTVNKAQSVAVAGDVICVRGGTYARERVTITRSGTSTSKLTIRAYPGEKVIFDGQADTVNKINFWFSSEGLVTIAASYVVLEDIEVKNSPTHCIHATGDGIEIRRTLTHHAWMNGLELHVSHSLIEDNEVYSTAMENYNGRSSSWAGGLSLGVRSQDVASTGVILRGNFVHEVWGEGLNVVRSKNFQSFGNTVRNAHSVGMIIEGQDGVIERNLVVKTADWNTPWHMRAFVWGEEAHWSYVPSFPALRLTIRNNIFIGTNPAAFLRMKPGGTYYSGIKILGNTFYGGGIHADGIQLNSTSGNLLRDNIIKGGVHITDRAAWDVSYNCYPDGNPTGEPLGANASTANPLFVNPGGTAAADYKLQSTSPVRGAGVELPDLTNDYWGTARTSPVSLGAHEF